MILGKQLLCRRKSTACSIRMLSGSHMYPPILILLNHFSSSNTSTSSVDSFVVRALNTSLSLSLQYKKRVSICFRSSLGLTHTHRHTHTHEHSDILLSQKFSRRISTTSSSRLSSPTCNPAYCCMITS